MSNRALYLDIDGVLNCQETHDEVAHNRRNGLDKPEWCRHFTRGDWLDTRKLKLVKDFVDKHDLHVIIVSAWAGGGTDVQELHEFLGFPFHSKAWNTVGDFRRGQGVQLHAERYGFDNWVVLDDSWREMYENWHHCVRMDGRLGVTWMDIEQAEDILERG